MKSIMYHYVREHDDALPYFTYLNTRNFEKQIAYFSAEGTILDSPQVGELLKGNFSLVHDKISYLLTFDDGLACQYRYVFPILKKSGLSAIFYVPSLPITSKKCFPYIKFIWFWGSAVESALPITTKRFIADFSGYLVCRNSEVFLSD